MKEKNEIFDNPRSPIKQFFDRAYEGYNKSERNSNMSGKSPKNCSMAFDKISIGFDIKRKLTHKSELINDKSSSCKSLNIHIDCKPSLSDDELVKKSGSFREIHINKKISSFKHLSSLNNNLCHKVLTKSNTVTPNLKLFKKSESKNYLSRRPIIIRHIIFQ